MRVAEVLQAKFGPLEGDDTVVEYLESVVEGLKEESAVTREDFESLLPMFEQAVGPGFREKLGLDQDEALEGAGVASFCDDVAERVGVKIGVDVEECNEVQEREVSLQCASLDAFRHDSKVLTAAREDGVKVSVGADGLKEKEKERKGGSGAGSKSKKKGRKGGEKPRKKGVKEGNNDVKAGEEQGSEWSSKRFELNHQAWSGNKNWKLHDHALTLAVDELDDDDYSSAWLECLRKGKSLNVGCSVLVCRLVVELRRLHYFRDPMGRTRCWRERCTAHYRRGERHQDSECFNGAGNERVA